MSYNLMADINSRQQEILEALSYQSALFKPSPWLNSFFDSQILPKFQGSIQSDLFSFDGAQPRLFDHSQNQRDQERIVKQENIAHQQQFQDQKESDNKIDFNQELKDQDLPLLQVIRILVNDIKKPQEQLFQKAKQLFKDQPQLMQVYRILHKKFKKLRKTKEQMVKYCMRKAFKTISQQHKYTSKYTNQIVNIKLESKRQSNINSILKKISCEKTMNNNFLKKIFSEREFSEDYSFFIQQFRDMIDQDNQKKIKYLANVIHHYLLTNNFKKIQLIKRLPWTKQILQKTLQLGRQLPNYANPQNFTIGKRYK